MSPVDSQVPFPFMLSGVESQSSPLSEEISAKFLRVPVTQAFIVNRIVSVVSPPAGIFVIFLVAVLPD